MTTVMIAAIAAGAGWLVGILRVGLGAKLVIAIIAILAMIMVSSNARAETMLEKFNKKVNEHRPPITFEMKEMEGGKLLLATPRLGVMRYAYPDLRTELRRQWHEKNPGRQLVQCAYESMGQGHITCLIAKK